MLRGVDVIRMSIGVRSGVTAAAAARFELGRPPSTTETAVVRLLGARQILQSAVVSRTGWRSSSAAVDLLHGLSMACVLAITPRRYGRAAVLQIATAVVLIALELSARRPNG